MTYESLYLGHPEACRRGVNPSWPQTIAQSIRSGSRPIQGPHLKGRGQSCLHLHENYPFPHA